MTTLASTAPETAALTAVEATALDDHEAIIEMGLAGFVAVGDALTAIRDRKLYRATHTTFEEYLRDRWHLSRSYAYRQIDAAEVTRMLPIGNTSPATESVARELAPLKDHPDEMREAWASVIATHGPKPTAGQVRQAVTSEVVVPDGDDHHGAQDPQRKKLSKAGEGRVIAIVNRLDLGWIIDTLDDTCLDEIEGAKHIEPELLGTLRNSRRELGRLIRRVEEREAP